jgi:hypothetical protein
MQPITLQLVINLKTAKALDIAIPPSVALKDTSAHHVLIPSTQAARKPIFGASPTAASAGVGG